MIENVDRFIGALLEERRAALKKFPTNKFQLPALVEEVGELSQALMQCQIGDGQRYGTMARNCSIINIYDEAVQVASMALRIATEGDANFPAYIPLVGDQTSEWAYPQYGGFQMYVVEKGERS